MFNKLVVIIFVLLLGLISVALGISSKHPKVSDAYVQPLSELLPAPSPTPWSVNEDTLWTMVNNYRVSKNLKPFVKKDDLCVLAQVRLEQIQTDWSHDQFYATAQKIMGRTVDLGENLGRMAGNEQDLLDSWLDSPSHKHNILFDFAYSCIETDGQYAIQTFGHY